MMDVLKWVPLLILVVLILIMAGILLFLLLQSLLDLSQALTD